MTVIGSPGLPGWTVVAPDRVPVDVMMIVPGPGTPMTPGLLPEAAEADMPSQL